MYFMHSKRKHKTTSRHDLAIGRATLSNGPTSSPTGEATRTKDSIVHGSDNVFEDLGFEVEEAANLKVRADLMLYLRQVRSKAGVDARPKQRPSLDETQPRISNLLKGEISRFSVDKLINMLAERGYRCGEDQLESRVVSGWPNYRAAPHRGPLATLNTPKGCVWAARGDRER